MEYLKYLYDNGKFAGFFKKYEAFADFKNYFKDVDSYKKLWEFLKSKEFQIPEFDIFLKQIDPNLKVNAQTNRKKLGRYKQPVAAVDTLEFNTSEILKLPDILHVCNLKVGGAEKIISGCIPFADSKGICYLIKTAQQKDKANNALQKIVLRLLCSLPINQSKIYILDNEKNGMSFNGLFGLDKKILEPEIWDDESEITQGLTEIKNKVPIILTKYLQNKYHNLAEYNQKIPHSNQPFQFLLVANFPKGFSKDSSDKLLNLIENGNKAGIYVLMSIDTTAKMPYETSLDDFLKSSTLIDLELNQIHNVPNSVYYNSKFYISEFDTEIPVYLEALKADLNKAVNEAKTVELDISKHLTEEWVQSAAKGVKIPIGVTQSNEPLDFTFGFNADVHHALIGGATGSGKSVLLHNIIVNGSYIYSPDDLQFILLDYKEGTEFKVYESLPSVKILSIAGEKEYGLSVFEFLAEEITKRGDLFKQFNAGNIAEYSTASGKKIPRYLVVIDEFQVLLSGTGSLSSKASILIEDISRRGRSFGINMILATQSLGDVDISGSTLSNIGLRIGMKMPEMDCVKILSMDNDAPLQFSRAGQAVYNTQNGLKSGNNLFQCAFIPKDKMAEKIDYLANKAKKSALNLTPFKQYIYDGNQSVTVANNSILKTLLNENIFQINNKFCDMYIGEPSYLQAEHYKYRFRKKYSSNVLLAGDDDDAAISFVYHSVLQAIKQSNNESKFYIFDLFDEDSDLSGQFEELKSMTTNCKVFSKNKLLDKLLDELKDELDLRVNEEGNKGRYIVCILNMLNIRELRKEGYGDLTPLASKLSVLLKDGADYGIHFILHALNYNLLMDCFESKILNEFENIVVLKGEDPTRYIDDLSLSPIKNKNTAYLKSPTSRYKADVIKIYKKEETWKV